MAIAIDGTPTTGTAHAGTTVNATGGFTPAGANEIVLVFTSADRTNAQGSVASVSSITDLGVAALTYTKHKAFSVNNFGASGAYVDIEIWYAITAGASNTNPRPNFSTTFDNAAIVVGAFSGINTSTPFDTNASLPNTGSSTSSIPSLTGNSTSYNKTVLIGTTFFSAASDTNAQSAGSGFTALANITSSNGTNFSRLSAEYQTTESSSPQSSATVAFSATWANWIMIATALVDSSATIPSTGNLFRLPDMSGLGSGGPFFKDPLASARVMLGWRKPKLWLPRRSFA